MYLQLPNFKYGLDTRRSELTSLPGTLATLNNAHINQGGEIEKRLAFVLDGALPSGSFGFEVTATGTLVFGSAADPGGWPTNVSYQRLPHPAVTLGATPASGHVMTAITASTPFGGNAWVSATYADGKTFAFYNGVYVANWTNGLVLTGWTSQAQIAGQLRTQVDAVTGFNVGAVTSGGSFQYFDMWSDAGLDYALSPSPLSSGKISTSGTVTATKISDGTDGVAAVTAISSFQIVAGSSGTITSVQVSADGSTWVELLGATITYTTDNLTTAQAIATQINNNINGNAVYSASSAFGSAGVVSTNGQVTLYADASLGATPNGYFVKTITTGDVCCDNTVFGFVGQVATNTCTSVQYNSTGSTFVEILNTTITFGSGSSIAAFVTAIAAAIRANGSTNATYTACAVGTNLVISRKTCNSFVPPGTGAKVTVSAGSITDNHTSAPIVIMALTLSPSPAVQTVSPFGGSSNITVTSSIAGGVAPYTYLWFPPNGNNIYISGANNLSSAKFKLDSGTASAVFRCTVTDSGGIEVTKNVTVSFQHS